MSHHHHHAAGSPHGDPPGVGDQRRVLAIAFGISVALLAAEFIGSMWTGSLALLTDAAHVLTDAVGLGVALVAANLMLRPATAKRTWGFRRVEVLAALAQACVLVGVGIFVAVEGVHRLFEPPQVPPVELLIFGIVGLVGNLIAVALLASSRTANFNMRAAFLEAANDALGSVGVIVAALVIALTGWQQADAVAGLLIAALIVPRAFVLLRDTTRVLMEFTPTGLDLDEVRTHLLSREHVLDVHELHATTVASGLANLSAHVVLEEECFNDGHAPQILAGIKACLHEHFELGHTTIELEPPGFGAVDPQHHR